MGEERATNVYLRVGSLAVQAAARVRAAEAEAGGVPMPGISAGAEPRVAAMGLIRALKDARRHLTPA